MKFDKTKKNMISLIAVMLVLSVMSVYADHTAEITLSPDKANCDDLGKTFTINVENTGGYAIYDVKISKTTVNTQSLDCGDAPVGWHTIVDDQYFCQYRAINPTGSATIASGENLDFTFNAVLDVPTQCASPFTVYTLDNEGLVGGPEDGQEQPHPLSLNVDCTDPVLTKTVGEPNVPCTEGEDCDYWINQTTNLNFHAVDNADECDLGIDYCTYRVKFDDEAWGDYVNEEAGDGVVDFDRQFDQDSNHYIEVECVDKAGNTVSLSEHDKVDSTPPETTKTYENPHFPSDINTGGPYPHYITSDTPISLDPNDGGPVCAIGVDKTWYITTLVDDSYCEDEESCDDICINPYDESCSNTQKTIDYYQDVCDADYSGYTSWEDCVQQNVQRCCDREEHADCAPDITTCDITCSEIDGSCGADDGIEDMWQLYKGTPFTIPDESCHLIQYFSIDDLNNIEPMKHQCVFVDDTPPMGTKDIGDPNVPCTEGEDCDYWVQDHTTPITLTCEDQLPHPVDHAKVCYKVGLDGSNVTDDYCDDSLTDGFCCVDSPKEVVFNEDSNHELQYYCVDALGNENDLDTEYFKVDSQPPVITKTMIGDNHLGYRNDYINEEACPPKSADDKCYVQDEGMNGVHIAVADDNTYPGCAVDQVTCSYMLLWGDKTMDDCANAGYDYFGEDEGKTWCTIESGDFGEEGKDIIFTEDSTHQLRVQCSDALGNENDKDIEDFLVDSTPPETNKTYGDPLKIDPDCEAEWESWCDDSWEMFGSYDDCVESKTHQYCTMWINSLTPITLASSDAKVGVDKVYWRTLQFPDNDEICDRRALWEDGDLKLLDDGFDGCNPEYYDAYINEEAAMNFQEYQDPFNIGEESCHVIEYYAVDKLGNQEQLKWQCVFVDNTPPDGVKTIGDPNIPIVVSDGSDGDGMADFGDIPAGSGSVTPDLVEATLAPGESTVVDKEVTTGELATASPEIYLLADTTGSMSSVLYSVRSNMNDILDSVDARFGAGEYRDFPGSPTSVFMNDQSITDNDALVTTAINGMSASGGGDGPEGALYALHKIAENAGGYSPDATKIVVWFGDAPAHDPVCSAISGEGSDITEASVTEELKNAGIIVIAISTTTGYTEGLDDDPTEYGGDYSGYCTEDGSPGQATRIAAATGGVHLTDVSSGDITTAIINAIGELTATTDVVPDASDCIDKGLEVTFDPEVREDVGGSETVSFEETIKLPDSADEGTAVACLVHFRSGALGGIIATERVVINGGSTEDEYWVRDHVTDITLDCVDPDPHPVEQETMCYRVSYDVEPWLTKDYCDEFGGNMTGDAVDDWCCVYVGDEPYTFTFQEDSVHDLEYYCKDHLGNTEPSTDKEIFRVDSIPPVTTKTYDPDPYIDPDTGYEYIDTVHKVDLSAEDGGETCAVGVDKTEYRVSGPLADNFCQDCEDWMTSLRPDMGPWMTYTEPFGIPEESCHVIEYRSTDNLGNEEDINWQCVFVDKTPPQITKTYGEPYFSEEGVEWISPLTPIYVSVTDPEPHPSGVAHTEYRVTQVADEYCNKSLSCDEAEGSGKWKSFDDPEEGEFSIPDESCHLIEISSTDNVGKNSLHKQCVFVDDTPPEPVKTVGDPKSKWDGADANFYDIADRCWNGEEDNIDCWKVTISTPISLKCVDPEPHPVDHAKTCFKIELDAEDATEGYCESYGGTMNYTGDDGFCCLDTEIDSFYFLDTSEHNLAYYCVDALGNKGSVDDEKFKVEETSFNITLNRKWNLISVPVQLLDDSIGAVFDQCKDEVISVWTYDAQSKDWYVYSPDGNDANDDLHTMVPGDGYWVLADEPCNLTIGGSLMKPGAHVPPTKPIVGDDWNLVGYFGAEGQPGYFGPAGNGKEAQCVFMSLGDNIWDYEFASLWSYWEPYNPNTWIPFNRYTRMDPGAGYWVYATADGNYVPPTACYDMI